MTAITTANVFEAFDEAADRYDLMVGLNPGYHGHLRRRPRPWSSGCRGRPAATAPPRCGWPTSAAARVPRPGRCCDATQARGVRARIVGVDASAGMLDQARAKSWPPGVSFEVGLAEELAFARESWGLGGPGAGGVRGVPVPQRDRAGQGAGRRVRPAGRRRHLRGPGVLGGRVAAGRVRLVAGLLERGHPAQLADLAADPALPLPVAQRAAVRLGRRPSSIGCTAPGFVDVEVRTVPGWQRGILHTFRARKPAAAPQP